MVAARGNASSQTSLMALLMSLRSTGQSSSRMPLSRKRHRTSRMPSASTVLYRLMRWRGRARLRMRSPDHATCRGSSTIPCLGPVSSLRLEGRRRLCSQRRCDGVGGVDIRGPEQVLRARSVRLGPASPVRGRGDDKPLHIGIEIGQRHLDLGGLHPLRSTVDGGFRVVPGSPDASSPAPSSVLATSAAGAWPSASACSSAAPPAASASAVEDDRPQRPALSHDG